MDDEPNPNIGKLRHSGPANLNAVDNVDIVAMVNTYKINVAPPMGSAEVARYLTAARRAFRLRSDAELARIVGVAPSAMGNWKSRGLVPDEHAAWFKSNLIAKIVACHDDLPFASMTARAAVIALIGRTAGNPLQVRGMEMTVGATMLGPLLAVAEFLSELEGVDSRTLRSDTVERIADLLESARPEFQRGLNPSIL